MNKSSLWFGNKEIIKLNELNCLMNRIPEYYEKIFKMKQKILDINRRTTKLNKIIEIEKRDIVKQ